MHYNTAGEQVTNILREKIFTGEIPDDTELTQTWVAEQLGVSRMPIREALLNLELEGFIERLDNRHTRVIGFEEKQKRSRLRFLSSLERDAAVVLMESEDLPSKTAHLSRFGKGELSCRDEIAFHDTLFELAGDRYLSQVYRKMVRPTLVLFIENLKTSAGDSHAAISTIIKHIEKRNRIDLTQDFDAYFGSIEPNLGV